MEKLEEINAIRAQIRREHYGERGQEGVIRPGERPVPRHEVVPMAQEIPRGPTRNEVEPGVPEVIHTPFEASKGNYTPEEIEKFRAITGETKRQKLEALAELLRAHQPPVVIAQKPPELAERYQEALFGIDGVLFAATNLLHNERMRCPVSGPAWVILSDLHGKVTAISSIVRGLQAEAEGMGKGEVVR